MIHWPDTMVLAIRDLKAAFAFVSDHSVLGVPFDLPFRFILLGLAYGFMSRKLPRRKAAVICTAVLLAKEAFDVVATRQFPHIHPPDWGDLADVASGLAGIVFAEFMIRLRERRRAPRDQ